MGRFHEVSLGFSSMRDEAEGFNRANVQTPTALPVLPPVLLHFRNRHTLHYFSGGMSRTFDATTRIATFIAVRLIPKLHSLRISLTARSHSTILAEDMRPPTRKGRQAPVNSQAYLLRLSRKRRETIRPALENPKDFV